MENFVMKTFTYETKSDKAELDKGLSEKIRLYMQQHPDYTEIERSAPSVSVSIAQLREGCVMIKEIAVTCKFERK